MDTNTPANPVTTTFCPKCGKATSQTWNHTVTNSTMPSVQFTVSTQLDTTTSVIMSIMQWCQWCQCANQVK